NPVFDPEGRYILFFSQRYFFPSIGQLDQRFNYYTTDGVFALTLQADEASPFKPESDEEKAAADKEKEKKEENKPAGKPGEEPKKEEGKEKKEVPPKPVQIDLTGIATRVAPVPIPSGIYGSLEVRKGKFFYIAQPQESRAFGTDQDGAPKGVLHVYDLEKR